MYRNVSSTFAERSYRMMHKIINQHFKDCMKRRRRIQIGFRLRRSEYSIELTIEYWESVIHYMVIIIIIIIFLHVFWYTAKVQGGMKRPFLGTTKDPRHKSWLKRHCHTASLLHETHYSLAEQCWFVLCLRSFQCFLRNILCSLFFVFYSALGSTVLGAWRYSFLFIFRTIVVVAVVFVAVVIVVVVLLARDLPTLAVLYI